MDVKKMTSKNIAFFLTVPECGALVTLATFRPLWINLDRRTLASLHAKGLIAFGAAPALTVAGRAAISLVTALRVASDHSEGSATVAPRSASALREVAAAPAA